MIQNLKKCPKNLGYRMPAEWEAHAATWLIWPHKEESWPGKLDRIAPIFVQMVKALERGERVNIIVQNEAMLRDVKWQLSAAHAFTPSTKFHLLPTNDSWIRDCGPIFVVRGKELAVTHWGYNAWGGKYPPWDLDEQVPEKIAAGHALPCFDAGMILEGGSIDVNGQGLLLTTEACLLNPNRNPTLNKAEIEARLKNFLGVEKILWLGDGIAGDDTDGHVDDLARFVNPNTIITVLEDDPTDDNYKILKDNYKRLQSMRDLNDKPFALITLPMPRPVFWENTRLPASYANFYIGNTVVLVPTFNDPNDAKAIDSLSRCFPTRKIVSIYAADLVWGLGAFHCLTQQEPAHHPNT